MYSGSKFSNWAEFDPYDSEIESLPGSLKCKKKFEIENIDIPIYERPLNNLFYRPYSVENIHRILSLIPAEFLQELNGVYILGGTKKQEKSANSLYRYGCYDPNNQNIYLHPYPRKLLQETYRKKPKPSKLQEFTRAGIEFVATKGGWNLEWTEDGLKYFYMYDVLLHEIGHHVDRENTHKNTAASERYAEWFAIEYEKQLRSNNKI